jgi:F420-non-reducing hydrogenase small subunit
VFADCGPLPTEVPACLDRVYAVDEVVQPDLCVPGCPPRPEAIAAALTAVLDDELPATPAKSVCETCPARREGRAATRTARRFLDNADFDPDEELTHMRCLLEQGLLCMGPVTAGGCGGSGVPLCVRVRVPCRGCYGPVRAGSNPLLDLMNALAGQGVDRRSVVDRRSLLRFCGGHGLLRPAAGPR